MELIRPDARLDSIQCESVFFRGKGYGAFTLHSFSYWIIVGGLVIRADGNPALARGAAQDRLLATGNFYGVGYREMDDGPRFFAWIGHPDALGHPDRYRSLVELTAHEYEALQKVHPPEPILADDYQFANFRRRFFEGRELLLEPWTM